MTDGACWKGRLTAVVRRLCGRTPVDVHDAPSPLTMWRWVYYFLRETLRLALILWGRFKVLGRERLPTCGPYIVAANHISYMDPPIVGCALTVPAYFMAKKELFDIPVFRRVIRRMGAFPVRRGSADRGAMKAALTMLESGENVAIFPEGTRHNPGELGEAGPGFGWLVHKARVAVVPVGIAGSADLLPRHASFIRPSVVRVAIGDPLCFDDLWEQADTRAAIREIGSRTMAAIQSLVEQAENDRTAASGHNTDIRPDAKEPAS